MGLAVKIAEIEAEMARTQKNKATEHHMGVLKAKVAKLKRDQLEAGSSKSGAPGEGFDVGKYGDARVGFIGFPSVGKSTLLTQLTGTYSEAASYEFTTLTCIPGVLHYAGSKIQVLDLPGIIEGAKDGKGRGRQVIAVSKTCNTILIVLDATKPLGHLRVIEHELEGFGIRLNKEPPDIRIKRKEKGGIIVTRTGVTEIADNTIVSICREYKITNADILMRGNITADDLVDVLSGNRVYVTALYIVNKIDQISLEELQSLDRLPHFIPISANLGWNMNYLKEKIWEYLGLVRVYTKKQGKRPDFEEPMMLSQRRCTVRDMCLKVHRDFERRFKYALVWGRSVKHCPQKVGKDHIFMDQDVVQLAIDKKSCN